MDALAREDDLKWIAGVCSFKSSSAFFVTHICQDTSGRWLESEWRSTHPSTSAAAPPPHADLPPLLLHLPPWAFLGCYPPLVAENSKDRSLPLVGVSSCSEVFFGIFIQWNKILKVNHKPTLRQWHGGKWAASFHDFITVPCQLAALKWD